MATPSLLVVDDEPIVRESIRDWLQDAGYDVATAESTEKAQKLMDTQEFSVMVLDVNLPGKTGIDFFQEVKMQHPLAQAIIMTANPSLETFQRVRELGNIDCLIKPIAPKELEQLIRKIIPSTEQAPVANSAR